jgi:hypothetical protein
MTHRAVELSGYSFEFALEPNESTSGCACLRIDLRSCQLNYWRPQNLVGTLVSVSDHGFSVESQDYFSLGDIERLRGALTQMQAGAHAPFHIRTEERTVALEFSRVGEGDVVVRGDIPPPDWHWDAWLEREPDFLRRKIKQFVRFEFHLHPGRLAPVIAQLDRFLAYTQTLFTEEGPNK